MDLSEIGTARQQIAVCYNKLENCICQCCEVIINKQELKIGFLLGSHQNDRTFWFHLNCFNFLRRHGGLEENQIQGKINGVNNLNSKDYDNVINYLKEQLKKLKQIQMVKRKKKNPSKDQNQKQEVKEFDNKKEINSSQSLRQSLSQLKLDIFIAKKKFNSSIAKAEVVQKQPVNKQTKSRNITFVKDKEEKGSLKSKKAYKSLPKVAKKIKTVKQKAFLTNSQVNQYKQLLEKYQALSNDKLKNILQKYGQPKTGVKKDLAQRCADGKQFGRIPTCSSCGGGKLRFNRLNGTYSCPGFMQDTDFVSCRAKFNFNEVNRLDWQQQ